MRFHRRNQKHIEKIFEEKTGVSFSQDKAVDRIKAEDRIKARDGGRDKDRCGSGNWSRSKKNFQKGFALAAAVLCLISLSAFAYSRFSGFNGDRLALESCYKGEGIFEIVVTNLSHKELELQKLVKLMRWSTGKEVEGDPAKIRIDTEAIAPHSQGILRVDLSEGYDVALLEQELPEGDWYYLVLTNNGFSFGQDWMCDIVFDTEQKASVVYGPKESTETSSTPKYAEDCRLVYEDWTWPTVSRTVSGLYGEQSNGYISDHINITGQKGDEVYAVAEGIVTETGFEKEFGNYIVLQLENDICVKYGHLEKIKVETRETVSQGQVIGTLGQSGTATGPNLALELTMEGETVNPLAETETAID